jgi:redox-sensitive bicupin YhaK (pirin superfamily)
MRGLLFWVNLARKDKDAEPSAQLLQPQDVPVRHDRDAIVRVLVGEGSPVELGAPGLILDVELPEGGGVASLVPSDFNGFAYMLEGEASFGANRRRASRSQIAVLGPGGALSVEEAQPGTRFMLMAGKPYGETPVCNGPTWTDATSALLSCELWPMRSASMVRCRGGPASPALRL